MRQTYNSVLKEVDSIFYYAGYYNYAKHKYNTFRIP